MPSGTFLRISFMKTLSKNIIAGMAITAMTAISPLAAFAQSTPVTPNSKGNFCTMIQNPEFKPFGKMDEKIEIKRDDRTSKIQDRRSALDNKRVETIKTGEIKRNEKIDTLSSQPMTDEQKAALAQTQTTLQSAVDTKNGDMTALIAEYRAAMDKVRAEHRTEVDALVGKVKTDIDAAIVKAKADCAAGVAPETAKATFQASVKATRDSFQSGRTSVQATTKTEVEKIAAARKADRVEVRTNFKTSAQSAWASFRALFGKKGE